MKVCVLFSILLLSVHNAHAAGFVFAHYMLWAPSSSDNVAGFKSEIQYAQSKGIDAFALNTNVWNTDIYRNRADQIYQAAQELGTNFKIFFSLDMHKNGGSLSAANVREMITRYSNHPNQFNYRNKQFVSAWLGNENNVFDGFSNALDAWNGAVFNQIGGKNKYYFVPFFPTGGTENEVTSLLNRYSSLVDGLYAWDTSAWPYFDNDFNNPSSRKDVAYLNACNRAGKSFMASISPWFFKHTDCCSGSCTNPTDQVSCGCQVKGNYKGPGLWITRWSQLIQNQPPLVEIVTWNDWVERSYVAPIRNPAWGPQDSNDLEFPHEAFLELGSHYIQWYKTGQQPGITTDSVFIFYYSEIKSATATSDPCKPQNWNVLDDRVYVVTKLKSPARVEIRSGGATQSFDVGAGVNTNSVQLQVGQQRAKVLRNNAQVVEVVGTKLVSNNFATYDYNVYSGFSSVGVGESYLVKNGSEPSENAK